MCHQSNFGLMPWHSRKSGHTKLALALLLVGLVMTNGGEDGDDIFTGYRQRTRSVGSGELMGGGYEPDDYQDSWRRCVGGTSQRHICGDGSLLGADLDARLSSPAPVPLQGHPPAPAALNGMAGLGAGTDGANSSGVADSVGTTARYSEWEALICAPLWDCAVALRIAECESSYQADAVSWNGTSFGLYQIWAGHAYRWPDFWSEWMNPYRNVEYAFELWQEQGWGIWNCW